MIVAMLLAAAQPLTATPVAQTSAIDAERAFAADAQKLGQWTAFRKWAAPDALMFTPQPVKAHDFLTGKTDPAVPVFWWPGKSFVSCDGRTAINTGPWVRDGGKSVGYFTTVWQRQPDGGWKWVYDAGDALAAPRAEGGDIAPTSASCAGMPSPMFGIHDYGVRKVGNGRSEDRTLFWSWLITPTGGRHFYAYLWNGRTMVKVIDDQVAAPPK